MSSGARMFDTFQCHRVGTAARFAGTPPDIDLQSPVASKSEKLSICLRLAIPGFATTILF
jgi:hypothetical protein